MGESHREIERLLFLYAERMDLGDFEGVAELFTHAMIVGPGGEAGPRGWDAVLAMYEATTRRYEDDGTPHTKHVTSNLLIDVDEEAGVATCRSYFTVFQALPDFPLQPIVAGRYHDRFERIDGSWRFSERKMMPELFGDMSRHMLIDITGGVDG